MNWKLALPALFLSLLSGCNERAHKPANTDAGAPVFGLNAEQAAKVVARIDSRAITLGDFARRLERMDQFDRLRYQTKERRRELLREMIDVELIADEAQRRGLDKGPEAEDAIRLILRDAMLAKAREGLPNPAQIPAEEVRAYFDANTDKFSEPERRRVAAIVMADKKEAAKVLKEAQKIKSPADWGELFFKYSTTAPKSRGAGNPAELAGDLGIVGPLDDSRGANPKVPKEVRAAVFKLENVGSIGSDLVEAEGKQYIIRLNGITAAHRRTMAEADRSIRVLLVQEKMQQRERALEEELRKKYPVQIDEQALSAVKLPAGMERWYAMDPNLWPQAEEGPPSSGGAPNGGAPPAPDGGAATPDGGS
jgi:parvulin-like peptidyl-prolyl isomerase